jgi:hypothetical protein
MPPPVTPPKPIVSPVVKPAPVEAPINPLRDFAGVLHVTFAEAHAANLASKAGK